jgi:quinohemoprotein ethanol dehydrogenase
VSHGPLASIASKLEQPARPRHGPPVLPDEMKRAILAALAGLYVLLAAFPELPVTLGKGVDKNWMYGVNLAHAMGLRFGRDLVFTFGPLAYLTSPMDVGSNLVSAFWFTTLLAWVLAGLAAVAVHRSASVVGASLFVLALVAAVRAPQSVVGPFPSLEYPVLYVVLLACAIALVERRFRPLLPLATFVSAVALLMKLSLGLACGAVLGTSLAVERLRGRLDSRHLAGFALGYALSLMALFVASGNQAEDLVPFLGRSFEIVLEYPWLSNRTGPVVELLLAAAGTAWLLWIAWTTRRRDVGRVLLVCVPSLLVVLKHGFIRHDMHALGFFSALLAYHAVAAVFADTTRDRARIAAGVLLCVVASMLIPAHRERKLEIASLLDPRLGVERIRAYVHWQDLRRRLQVQSTRVLRRHRLSDELRERLQPEGVAILGYETMDLAANHLRWQAPFTLMFPWGAAAGSREAQHLAGANAPAHLLYRFRASDGRHPFFERPVSIRTLLCRYVPAARERGLLVLRRVESRCDEPVSVSARTITLEQEVRVPRDQQGLFVRVETALRRHGRIASLLLRPPVLSMVVSYRDGEERTYRLAPRVATAGVPIGHLPRSLDDVDAMLSGRPGQSVRSFRLVSDHPGWFKKVVKIEFGRVSASLTPHIRGATAGIDDTRLQAASGEPGNWLTHGGTYAEERFSPLQQIDDGNVKDLALLWSFEFRWRARHEATPLVVDGVLFTTEARNIVNAIDARTGYGIWRHDPGIAREYAKKGCCGVINRGVALYRGKVYTATFDGRLIALDAATGAPVWEVLTVDQGLPYTITGAPRVVESKIIIGNAGADFGVRGYVSAYDADTGDLVWRTYTVPGDPSQPFESEAMARAAQTWTGEWWKYGGGGTVFDGISYDPVLRLLYVGTGNGSPWPRVLRSPGGGDNLYLASVLALRPDDGEQVWHYQESPGDSWDYASTQQMVLTRLTIGGRERDVLLHAPKNGFFYVLDRATGELLSAEKIAEVTWATHVELETGRPVEVEGAHFANGEFLLKPSQYGAHSWAPMSYNPKTGLVYLPVQEIEARVTIDRAWRHQPGVLNSGVVREVPLESARGHLLAWDPVGQREVWRARHEKAINGGTLTTGGNLVFQGTADGRFIAYRADDGHKLWEVATGSSIGAGPITYLVGGVQQVSVAVGNGSGLRASPTSEGRGRLLTFALRHSPRDRAQ